MNTNSTTAQKATYLLTSILRTAEENFKKHTQEQEQVVLEHVEEAIEQSQ